jgi:hypothetical protein
MKIVLGLLLIALVFANTCGGNCPPGNCPTCYCGTTKSILDSATWCAKYSWNQNCCKCIIAHESSGNAHNVNFNTDKTTDVGLWQINQVSSFISLAQLGKMQWRKPPLWPHRQLKMRDCCLSIGRKHL